MESDEITCEPLAEPVAEFGLHNPMLPGVVAYVPEIDLAGDVGGPFGTQPDFDTQIGRENSVREKVGL